MTRHIHFYFTLWQNESRAWRTGSTAIKHGYATEAVYVGYRKAGLPDREEISPDQIILRIGDEPPGPSVPKFKRALALPRWWRALQREVSAENASLVVAHSLAALPGALYFARQHKLPLLYDAHELESERNGWPYPLRRLARLVEGRLIRRCGHTIVVNDSIKEWYQDAYPGISINTVKNVPLIPKTLGKSTLRQDLNIPKEALVFIYCGALAPGRGLPELIDVFRGFKPERQLVIIGRGAMTDDLRTLSQNVDNVHICEPLPQSELLAFLTGADVGIAVVDGSSLSYLFCLPNKVFEYAAAGLALCMSPGPELERLAESYPLARISSLTVEDLNRVLSQFSRTELDAARPSIQAFKPPSWEMEHPHLLKAFDIALASKGAQHT